jgi:hypothetical protein
MHQGKRVNVMLRSIAKWYISRAIDCKRELPAWVASRIARDPHLEQFYVQSQRLTARLRASEAALVSDASREAGFDVVPLRSANRPSALVITCTVGLAAVVLLAIMPFFNGADPKIGGEPIVKAETKAEPTHGLAPDRIDPQRVRDLIASGRTLVKQLKQGSERLVEPAIDEDLKQLVALSSLDIRQVFKPIGEMGTSYGELLSKLEEQKEDENRRLISSGVEAWSYLVHTLPQSAASLAGL